MKKIARSLLVTLALSFTFLNNAHAADVGNENLTVKQGETEVQKYLKAQHLNYNINSQDYINFLQSINEKADEITKSGYNFSLMEVYSDTYLEELAKYVAQEEKKDENGEVEVKNFDLPKKVENESVKQVQQENIKEDKQAEEKVEEIKEESGQIPIDYMSSTNSNSFFVTQLGSSYSRSAAKKYMVNNWDKKTSKYGYYGESSGGGDCTNYASQVVLAGGMPMNTTGFSFNRGHHKTTKGWYNQSVPKSAARTYSTSWTVVSDFYTYWAGTKKHKVYNLTSPKDVSKYVKTGDVIQMYSKSSKKWKHTAVIYDVYKGYPRYSAHSSAHLYAHLEKDWKSKYYKYRVIKF
ncbi:amidase domain-containing protein [Bacillus atrophaeus]|uniref:amidase domain-containing protein n=1 Tax=Bacillus atrophaeus TaxID=1452 RepID=UPI00227F8866|nr:amidase domain-containing protein [Bacillus atrophaeus]MCY8960045.1 amidase domain-containing protein [Bacillus atrophaeus]MCY8965292.1 amidase domain-containing protein [Bacillus atrophaeus]MCY9439140.1 amidase domain-containing protein [Bacillus atrophaeus]MEC0650061.1 amidase domain-containing protein [Bacillus atrophaeus]